MAWMAVPLKIIICFFSVLFLGLVIFSVAFVSRPGGSSCYISKISNQLIYFLSLGLFFLQFHIALSCTTQHLSAARRLYELTSVDVF